MNTLRRTKDWMIIAVAALSFFELFRGSGGIDKAHWITFSVIIAGAVGLISTFLSERLFGLLSRKRRVFISYSRHSEESGRRVAEELVRSGFKVWDAEDHLQPGSEVLPIIQNAIKDSDVMVVLLSRSPKGWVNLELETALKNNIKIIPILVDDDVDIPEEIKGIGYVDLRHDKDAIKRLTEAVSR